MIDVEVDEDWTATVTNTPIITPTTGFFSISEFENRVPMFLPPRILKLSERNEREQMKKYRQRIKETIFVVTVIVSFIFLTRPMTGAAILYQLDYLIKIL